MFLTHFIADNIMQQQLTRLAVVLMACFSIYSCGSGDSSNTAELAADPNTMTMGAVDADNENIAAERSDAAANVADIAALADAINGFGVAMLNEVSGTDGNTIFSPYALATALSAITSGAGGDTFDELVFTLNADAPGRDLYPAANHLDLSLNDRFEGLGTFRALWGQTGYRVHIDFYNQLITAYGMAFNACDFEADHAAAETLIDLWISEKIMDDAAMAAYRLSDLTRLALADIIRLDATWAAPFDPLLTTTAVFNLIDDTTHTTDFMVRVGDYAYLAAKNFQAVEIPLADPGLSVLLILPDEDNFSDVKDELTADKIAEISGLLETRPLTLTVPRFSFGLSSRLEEALTSMGISKAFDKCAADFSNINDVDTLFVENTRLQTRVAVTETGWTSEAATLLSMESPYRLNELYPGNGFIAFIITDPGYSAIDLTIIGLTPGLMPPPPRVTFDRPFIFMVKDKTSDVILFMGSVMDPSE